MLLQNIAERTQRTVLYFYPRDNTPGCTTEAIEFTSLVDDFKKLNTQIVGVSKDSVNSHCNFMEKHGLKIDLISDEDLSLHKMYGAWGEKNNYGKIVE
jgi:peroxiredoxin Q/BCP